MSLVRVRPLGLLNEWNRQLDNIFSNRMMFSGEEDSLTSDLIPPVDIKEEKNQYVITAELAGVKPEDIELNMHDDVLTIKGEKKTESKETKQGYMRIERLSGSFSRSIRLPDAVNNEGISATSKNGVVEITVPKRSETMPRSIPVKEAK